jgi:ribosome recycling factor
MFTQQEEVKKRMDKDMEKVDALLAAKEKEIMEI